MEPAKSCNKCYVSLHAPDDRLPLERELLTDIRTYGGLLKPSDSLFELIMQLEHAVLTSTVNSQIHTMLLFDTLERLTGVELQRVGCEVHARTLTASVVTFYMICRMHFTCADANKVYAETKRRKRDLAKQAKLS
ncbi:Flagellar brake protein YcgR [Frankliniella fusca]|uniref:Flagellar brake protein YcgR n=1 Tax=Frankliniella fusca TaxID=407009 RepID=A0AAE1LGM0_9NEOP|nr:Flagellar brake protein YcgR [Frankliniella fusca]